MGKQIEEAIKVFKNGGIVIFPTDTAFGIGCRIDDNKAVSRLFEIRKRSKNKAVPVLVDSIDMARRYVEEIPQDTEKLMKKYWPGALTLILQCIKEKVPELVRRRNTLGVRIPNHEIILRIISEVGVPILGPSANFSGEKTPFEFKDLNPKLAEQADYILNGKAGLEKKVSTIVDCTAIPWKVIREGAVSIVSS